MKFAAICAAFLLLFSALAVSLPDYSEAARMGGGRSFGGRPSMSAPASRPAQRSQAQQAQPGSTMRSPGMMSGLFGGLLAGTLLGSLLGGHGMGGGGGLLDIILLAIVAYVGYRLYKRFKANQGRETAPAVAPFARQSTGGDMWNNLRQNFGPGSSQPQVDVPAGFDTKDFLEGAKMAYKRMQESWDKRDLQDIAHFATPAVIHNLEKQRDADPNPSRTELVLVNAELLGVETEGDDTRAQVYFDVLMRENPNQQSPEAVREVWHFVRSGQNGNWKLDGIQQVQ
ncbi:MAG: 39S ribosomal protein L45 [Desulfovibrio sp.]|nr:39S ribosomal protein L45 [Desulfovibrio sp.]